MFFSLLLLLTSCLTCQTSNVMMNNNHHIYKNDNFSVDYLCDYSNSTRYSTGLNKSFILNTVYGNETYCKELCAYNNDCKGLFTYYVGNLQYCNMLTNLGIEVYSDQNNIHSYRKITYPRYSNNIHNLNGYIFSNNINSSSIVYLDINHNNILDEREPFVNTTSYFNFDNLTSGNYLIRTLNSHHCVTIYPDVFGHYKSIYNFNLKNYTINYYNVSNISGGVGNLSLNLDNLDYIIDNDNNTFVTFNDNDTVILSLSDHTILDDEGDDIFFEINGNGTLNAQVSVSTLYGFEHSLLGILNSTNLNFDLSKINYTYPVNHIYLNFFGNGNLSISNIKSNYNNVYTPPFSYYLNIPFNENLYFIQDCHYMETCKNYCDYTKYSWNNYISCLDGCNIFKINNNCILYNYNRDNFLYSYMSFNFIENDFFDGCEYNMQKSVWPDYTISKSNGYNEYITNNISNCSNCLDTLLTHCNNICPAFSLHSDGGYIYNSDLYFNYNSSYFFKNNHHYISSPPTISPTRLPTLSPTRLPTLSPTRLPTLSPTRLPTLSPTYIPVRIVSSSEKSSSSNNFFNNMFEGTNMIIFILLLILIILLVCFFSNILYKYCNKGKNYDVELKKPRSIINPLYDNDDRLDYNRDSEQKIYITEQIESNL